MRKTKICFVNLKMFHILTSDTNSQGMGGAELQVLLIAKELVRRGYDVSFVTYAHDAKDFDGSIPFRFFQTFRPGAGIPLIRFFYPTIFTIVRALWKANADIYYCNVTGIMIALVVIVARLRGRKTIFSGASDTNFQPDQSRMTSFKGRKLYFWGLKYCDAYITQNSIQQTLLRDNFGKVGTTIHTGFPVPSKVSHRTGPVLWVGSIRKVKDPLKCVELAGRLPHQRFVMIGGPMLNKGDEPGEFFEYVAGCARKVPNLEFKGFLPMETTDRFFEDAKVFVNTSSVEGFPNTFLQAWSRGVPIVSFVNPDNLISDHRLGVVVKDLDEMVEVVERLCSAPEEFTVEHITGFFQKHLTIDSVADKHEAIFRTVMNGQGTA